MARLAIFACILLVPGVAARADNWPNWRGPLGNGIAAGKNYPIEWDSKKNVLWKIKLPGRGASTPIVWNDLIVLTFGANDKNYVLGLDRQGKEKFRTELGEEREGKNKKATGSNPSAITDGEHIFVYFKSGDLACLDMKGGIVWQLNLQEKYGKDTLWWDLGTSPVLTRNAVVVACMHSGPSYVAAFEKETGKVLWKEDRNLNAPDEAAQSYTTPVVTEENGQETVYVLGADHVTAHDAVTGRELWRCGGLNPTNQRFFRSIASPAVGNGILVAPYARGDSLTGIKLGGTGDVTESHVAWTKTQAGADVPSPAIIDGKVYICRDRGYVACHDLMSGETLWTGRLEESRQPYSSSPIIADGKIYVTREDGHVFVLAQGPEFKVLASNGLADEFVVATPAFADGQILIRTMENLYCIGQK